MRYLIWIIIVSQICSVAILGCLTSSKKEGNNAELVDDSYDSDIVIIERNLTGSGFDLDLDINGSVFKKEFPPIEITVILTNLANVAVKLETYRINFPCIMITDPQNTFFLLHHGNISVAPHYEIMLKNDSITTQFHLHQYDYFDENYHLIHESIFKEVGNYTCQVFAYNLESNRVEFTLY